MLHGHVFQRVVQIESPGVHHLFARDVNDLYAFTSANDGGIAVAARNGNVFANFFALCSGADGAG